ncbi:glycosyltransferase involved in cell wall biosynthesis [Sinobacterium caligoides]|uniref:Glycosyltransferase involved in cell wall biosynthesis n=1 Tax=Sinobacterium caligoides TaxID=933926 RepID=A0A3N2DHG6_9GAMM|nr:glycosyltransferase family 4 protein [Sinobacterium caligoides]ROR98824.1 glycosyltransferase involved in cell wall biosynthesis [Sinobacterium caligoides]
MNAKLKGLQEDVGSLSEPASNISDRSSKSLKICLLGYRSHPYGGGQGIYLKYLSKALVDAGHSVDVISGEPYPHLDDRVSLIKMPGLNLYENGLGSLRLHHLKSRANIVEWLSKLTGGFAEMQAFGRRTVAYLRREGRHYDIIHDNQSLSFGMLKLQQLGFPLVSTIHHPITRDLEIALAAANSWREKLLIRRWHSFLDMQRFVVKRLNHLQTVSNRSKRDIAQAFGIDQARLNLVYCGIDTEEFHPMPEVKKVAYRLMATASADAPLKGLRYLLEAIAQLSVKYPDLSLLLVGKPQPGGDTEQLISRLNIGDRITFVHGISTEQMVEYYAQAEIAVVPSVYEGFGLPAGEAMSCGVALVSTDGGALPEVVGNAGMQVPVRDSAAIAAAVDELFQSPKKREELAAAGRRRIEEKFCWHLAAEQMIEFYRDVLKRHENS